MKTKKAGAILFSFAAILFVMLSGCVGPPAGQSADDTGFTEQGVKDAIAANNTFALEFYNQINEEGKNVFFSPYSMEEAFAMVFEGAKGNTADEIKNVFHYQADTAVRRASMAKVYNLMNSGHGEYTLYTANALWVQKDYNLLKDYTSVADKYYVGRASNLDFVSDPEGSRQTINSWAEEKTNKKITGLLPPEGVSNRTRLVLTNAIYFKGEWTSKFKETQTREADFKVSDEKTVKTLMMNQTEGFGYTETEDLQALEMPYKGNELSMLVLLPKEGKDLKTIEAGLTAKKLSEIRGKLLKNEVYVSFPKFTFKTDYKLKDTLQKMGIIDAFDLQKADFSGINGIDHPSDQNLYIGFAVHKAYVKVDEEGTEAAAAIAISMSIGAALPRQFNANHPFIFIIQERTAGGIMFIGKMADPTAQ